VGGLALALFLALPLLLGTWGLTLGVEAMTIVLVSSLCYALALWVMRSRLGLGLRRLKPDPIAGDPSMQVSGVPLEEPERRP
jgi:hypothetical protein